MMGAEDAGSDMRDDIFGTVVTSSSPVLVLSISLKTSSSAIVSTGCASVDTDPDPMLAFLVL